ncbi:uromodulin-like [Lissotriton helveticus]
MALLMALLFAALLGEAGAVDCSAAYPLCNACAGSCVQGAGCFCGTDGSTCLPQTCDMDTLCCPDGLFWHTSANCCSLEPTCYPACMADEACKLPEGVCICNSTLHQGAQVTDVVPMFMCDEALITITVPKCLLEKLRYNPAGMHVRTPTVDCMNSYNQVLNGIRMWSEQILPVTGFCGNEVVINGTYTTYSNYLEIPAATINGIIYVPNLRYNFSCSYPRNILASLDTVINPISSTLTLSLGGASGVITVTMAAFWDSSYTNPITAVQQIDVGTTFYFGLSAASPDDGTFVLRADSCYATPVNDPNSPTRVNLITGGCSADQGVTTQVLMNGVAMSVFFSAESFAFDGISSVYVFCNTRLCVKAGGNCTACGNIAGRSAGSSGNIGVGPFTMSEIPELNFASQTVVSWTVLVSSLITLLSVRLM